MPGKKTSNTLPGKTLTIIVGAALLVGIILFAGLFPKYLGIQKIRKQTVDKQIQLDRQQTLFPVYAMAQSLFSQDTSFSLPLVEKKAMDRQMISGVTSTFESIAAKTQMTLSGSTIDTGQLTRDGDFISVELSLYGSLENFRQYLIHLAGLSYFKTIEQINIAAEQDTGKKFVAKIQILVDQK
jgi:hypothetical protein